MSKYAKDDIVSVNPKRIPDKVRMSDTRDGSNNVVSKDEVINAVNESGLDLVLVTDKPDIPVYRLVDIGKHRYEMKKNAKAKRNDSPKGKEFVFSPLIGDHDYDTKMRQLRKAMGDHEITVSSIRNYRTSNGFPRGVSLKRLAYDPEFILQRVLSDLKDDLEVKSANISDRRIQFILKPAT